MSSIPDAEVLLAVDIGSVNTRASLFDIVDGSYRLVATSKTPSTVSAPLLDYGEGVRTAIDQIREITGRRLLDESESPIVPTTGFGEGIDLFVGSISAGPRVRTLIAGLMPAVSLLSARRLADSASIEVVGEISPGDGRRIEEQIDLILAERPDLILLVGGTDTGARDPILRLVDVVGLAIGLMPEGHRPRVVYAGNRDISAAVIERLSDRTTVTLLSNPRPSIDVEDLEPARLRLAEVVFELNASQVGGLQELQHWSGESIVPTAEAFGRLTRYLSKIYEPDKGVLGVDLGASQVTIALAFGGRLSLLMDPGLGTGAPIGGLLDRVDVAEISRWLPIDADDSAVSDYLHNKAIYPTSVPATAEDLHLECALARELIRAAVVRSRGRWPDAWRRGRSSLVPPVEPILATGACLAGTPKPGYAALILLDALQPVGITTLVLDPYGLAPALGAAAGRLPMATVQLMEAGVLVALGTVVAPSGRAKPGRKVLTYELEPEGGGVGSRGEVLHGQLLALPLASGEYGRLRLDPGRGFDLGLGGSGRGGTLRVAGGAAGVIIDARGRPLGLPGDPEARREMSLKWLWQIGALE